MTLRNCTGNRDAFYQLLVHLKEMFLTDFMLFISMH